MDSPAAYDHVRPTRADYPDGIYRVVGTGGDGVTLLRVADADGRRANTGDLVTVGDDEFVGFEAASNPDGDRPPGAVVASKVETAYWSVRVFGRQLAARPLPTAVALALVGTGTVGAPFVPLPEAVLDGLVLLGSLGLALVGSGRL